MKKLLFIIMLCFSVPVFAEQPSLPDNPEFKEPNTKQLIVTLKICNKVFYVFNVLKDINTGKGVVYHGIIDDITQNPDAMAMLRYSMRHSQTTGRSEDLTNELGLNCV